MHDVDTPTDVNGPDPLGELGANRARTGLPNLEDLAMLRKALRAGWDIPEEAKRLAPQRMLEILRDDGSGERAWASAARTLVAMDGVTLSAIDTALKVRAQEELVERVEQLEARLAQKGMVK